MTAKKSQNPAYPDAHPGAPGGMSRKGLIAELIDTHGYEGPASAWDEVSWPDLIDLVCDERLAAEKQPERPEPDDADDTERIETEPDVEDAATELLDALAGPLADIADMAEREQEEVDEFDALLAEMIDEDFTAATDRPLDAEVLAPSTDEPDDFETFEVDIEVELGKAIADEDGVLDPEALFAEMSAAHDEYEDSLPPPLFIGLPGVRDYIFDGHAGAGPSGAERWMNCTMSLTASRKFLETLTPRQQEQYAQAGTAAQQGTTAHSVGEAEANHMLGRITTEELDTTLLELAANPIDEDTAYDDEMAEYVAEYVALVSTYTTERGADAIRIESRVEAAIPLTGGHDGETYVIHGSLDFSARPTPEHNSLVVGDLKYGKGLEVDVDGNPQIREYAIGELGEMMEQGIDIFALDEIVYYIIQPRLGGIKKWSESVDDLLAWRDDVLAPALTKALYGEAEGATFEPSDLACQWCPARGGCAALAEDRMLHAAELFDEVMDAEVEDGLGALPNPETLDGDRLGDLLAQARSIEGLAKALKEEAQRRLHRGEPVKNFHLVSYTPSRSWKGDYAADPVATLNQVKGLSTEQKRALFKPRTLVTPTAAEKILKDDYTAVVELIDVPDKRPVISTGPTDRRKAWEGKPPEQMFEIEEDE